MTAYTEINDSQNPALVLLQKLRWEFISSKEKPLVPEFKTEGIFTVVLQRINAKSSGKSSGKGSGKGSVDDWNEQKSNIIEKSKVRLGKTALKILEMVYNNQNVTIPEMSKSIGITERGIEKNIKNLRENKILERRDGERSGYWEIII